MSSTWTEKFQMYKLDLEKAEDKEMKLPNSVGSYWKQGKPRKTSTSASSTILKAFDCEDHNKLLKCFKEMEIQDHLTCLPRNQHAGQEVTESDIEQWTGSKLEKEYVKVI